MAVPHAQHPPSHRILVIDDCTEDRQLLGDFLRRQGYRLYVGDNGRDGFEKARYVRPDLVLMDIHMPVCDGIAACRLLKADPQTASIPLIFLTAAALPHERVLGLSEGAVDYITKPFDFDEVRLRLRIHLRDQLHAHSPAQLNAQLNDSRGSVPTADAPAADSRQPLESTLFHAAQHILLAQLADPPDLAELARAVGTSRQRLNDAFQKCAGTSVFNYLREARMQEARRLLCETALEVQSIANDLGYGNAANFSTAFRERFGLSPRQYRQTSQAGEAP